MDISSRNSRGAEPWKLLIKIQSPYHSSYTHRQRLKSMCHLLPLDPYYPIVSPINQKPSSNHKSKLGLKNQWPKHILWHPLCWVYMNDTSSNTHSLKIHLLILCTVLSRDHILSPFHRPFEHYLARYFRTSWGRYLRCTCLPTWDRGNSAARGWTTKLWWGTNIPPKWHCCSSWSEHQQALRMLEKE